MIQATRTVTLRDFFIFQLKLLLDGVKDIVMFWLSIGAMVFDFLSGRGKRPRLFYAVLRASERFDLWLNLSEPLQRLEKDSMDGDGLFGASKAGSGTMLGELERVIRGGDEPRRARAHAPAPARATANARRR